MKLIFGMLLLVSNSVIANQWVKGDIVKLQEYGAYSNGQYQFLIELKDRSWPGAGDGSSVCTGRFRIMDGAEGVTNEIKSRMVSMLIASYMANKKVALFVNTSSAPYCNVIVTGMGDDANLP
jgi:hypothetical protein